VDGARHPPGRLPKTDDPEIVECFEYGRARPTLHAPNGDAPRLLIEAWKYARAPLNLAEYAQMDTRWLSELELALAAFLDGQRQQQDISRQMEEALAGRKRSSVVA
jgi:hypothetical protein